MKPDFKVLINFKTIITSNGGGKNTLFNLLKKLI